VRFGDLIKFNYQIDKSLLDYKVPPFIIQPLLENATIHGIGNKEEGGTITTIIEKKGDRMHITVHDDGVGMDEKTKEQILKGVDFNNTSNWHTTGIGINNVLQRLNLFFDDKNMLEINSSPGGGTSVTLKIPKMTDKNAAKREGVGDV
jgi:sensor histidine kinase YesM